jgi:hypothetical protein
MGCVALFWSMKILLLRLILQYSSILHTWIHYLHSSPILPTYMKYLCSHSNTTIYRRIVGKSLQSIATSFCNRAYFYWATGIVSPAWFRFPLFGSSIMHESVIYLHPIHHAYMACLYSHCNIICIDYRRQASTIDCYIVFIIDSTSIVWLPLCL